MRPNPKVSAHQPFARRSRAHRVMVVGATLVAPVVTWLALMTTRAHAEPPPTAAAAYPDGILRPTPSQDKNDADALFRGHFVVNDDNPESNIPTETERNKHPLDFGHFLIALSDKAEDAMQRGEPVVAAKYFRAIVLAVPDRSAGFTKLCNAYEVAKQRDKAEAACGAALLREGVTIDDYAHYVRLVIAQKEPLDPKQINHVDDVVTHLSKQVPKLPVSAELQCQLGLRLKDEARLDKCTRILEKLSPNEKSTISFSWLLAVMRHDRKAAFSLLDRAKRAGFQADTLGWMDPATRGLRTPLEQALYRAGPALGITLLLSSLVGAALYLRRRMQRQPKPALRKSNA